MADSPLNADQAGKQPAGAPQAGSAPEAPRVSAREVVHQAAMRRRLQGQRLVITRVAEEAIAPPVAPPIAAELAGEENNAGKVRPRQRSRQSAIVAAVADEGPRFRVVRQIGRQASAAPGSNVIPLRPAAIEGTEDLTRPQLRVVTRSVGETTDEATSAPEEEKTGGSGGPPTGGPGAPEAPAKPKRKPNTLVLGLLAACVLAGGIYEYQQIAYHVETDDATVSSTLHDVASRLPGTVQQVLVYENQPVKRGTPLLALDADDLDTKVQQAQQALHLVEEQAEVARAAIAVQSQTLAAQNQQANGNVKAADEAVAAAESRLKATNARLALETQARRQATVESNWNAREWKRIQTLFQSGAATRQQLDLARKGYDLAKSRLQQEDSRFSEINADLASAQAEIARQQALKESSLSGLGFAQATALDLRAKQAQVQVAEAAVAQAKAVLREARLQRSYATIYAPSDGRIGRKAVEVGQRVQPGQALMVVVERDAWIEANFKETQIGRLKVGQRATIKVDAFPGHPLTGRIDSISPASGSTFALLPPENATGNFNKVVQRVPVRIALSKEDSAALAGKLEPGMSVFVDIDTRQ